MLKRSGSLNPTASVISSLSAYSGLRLCFQHISGPGNRTQHVSQPLLSFCNTNSPLGHNSCEVFLQSSDLNTGCVVSGTYSPCVKSGILTAPKALLAYLLTSKNSPLIRQSLFLRNCNENNLETPARTYIAYLQAHAHLSTETPLSSVRSPIHKAKVSLSSTMSSYTSQDGTNLLFPKIRDTALVNITPATFFNKIMESNTNAYRCLTRPVVTCIYILMGVSRRLADSAQTHVRLQAQDMVKRVCSFQA